MKLSVCSSLEVNLVPMSKQISICQRRLWWLTLHDLYTHWMSHNSYIKNPCSKHRCSVLTSNATDDSTECAYSCIIWTECDPHLVRRRSDNTRWVNTEAFNHLWHWTRTITNLHIKKGIVYLLGDKYLLCKCLLDPHDMVQCRSSFGCRSISDNLISVEAILCQKR